jgi:hypothetical protein
VRAFHSELNQRDACHFDHAKNYGTPRPTKAPDPVYDKNEAFDKRYGGAYARALKQIEPLLADADLAAQSKLAAAEKDTKQWARESFELAKEKEKVYDATIRNKIIANDRDLLHIYRGVFVRLPDDYRERAHEIGKPSVVLGGYRTAEFFKGF